MTTHESYRKLTDVLQTAQTRRQSYSITFDRMRDAGVTVDCYPDTPFTTRQSAGDAYAAYKAMPRNVLVALIHGPDSPAATNLRVRGLGDYRPLVANPDPSKSDPVRLGDDHPAMAPLLPYFGQGPSDDANNAMNKVLSAVLDSDDAQLAAIMFGRAYMTHDTPGSIKSDHAAIAALCSDIPDADPADVARRVTSAIKASIVDANWRVVCGEPTRKRRTPADNTETATPADVEAVDGMTF